MTVQMLKLNEMDFKDHQITPLIKTSEAYTYYNIYTYTKIRQSFFITPLFHTTTLLILLMLHIHLH